MLWKRLQTSYREASRQVVIYLSSLRASRRYRYRDIDACLALLAKARRKQLQEVTVRNSFIQNLAYVNNTLTDETSATQSQLVGTALGLRPFHRPKTSQTSSHGDDDSPFITPRSPPFGPSKSIMNILRGDSSVSICLWQSYVTYPDT